MTICCSSPATASVGLSTPYSHSHIFSDARHPTTFPQPMSRQPKPGTSTQTTALKRARDALTRPSHDAVAPKGYDESPSTWDTESPQGARDASLLGLCRHPEVDEQRTPHQWDTEAPQGPRDAGPSGLQRPRIDDPTLPHDWNPRSSKGCITTGLSRSDASIGHSQTITDALHVLFLDSDKADSFPGRIIEVHDHAGIKRYTFDPNHAKLLTLAMQLVGSAYNDCLQAAGLPRTFSFGRSSHYDMEIPDLIYRRWPTRLILKAIECRVLARLLVASEMLTSLIGAVGLNFKEGSPCLTSLTSSINSTLSKEVQEMTTLDQVSLLGDSPSAEGQRWFQRLHQEKNAAISSLTAASALRLSQDASIAEPTGKPAGSPMEPPEPQSKRNPTRDITAGIAELEVMKPQPLQPIPATQDLTGLQPTRSIAMAPTLYRPTAAERSLRLPNTDEVSTEPKAKDWSRSPPPGLNLKIAGQESIIQPIRDPDKFPTAGVSTQRCSVDQSWSPQVPRPSDSQYPPAGNGVCVPFGYDHQLPNASGEIAFKQWKDLLDMRGPLDSSTLSSDYHQRPRKDSRLSRSLCPARLVDLTQPSPACDKTVASSYLNPPPISFPQMSLDLLDERSRGSECQITSQVPCLKDDATSSAHRGAETTSSRVIPDTALASSGHLSNLRPPEAHVALPKSARDTKKAEILLGVYSTSATSYRDDRPPATTAKGQQAQLNPLLRDVHQAATVSRSYECGDSVQWNISHSSSLQNGSTTLTHRKDELTQALQPNQPHNLQHQRTNMEVARLQTLTSSRVSPDDTTITASGHLVAPNHSGMPRNLARLQDGRTTSTRQDGEVRMRQCAATMQMNPRVVSQPDDQHPAATSNARDCPVSSSLQSLSHPANLSLIAPPDHSMTMEEGLTVPDGAGDRISPMRSSPPEPCLLGTYFHREVNIALSYKRDDSTYLSSSCSSSLLNSSTTLAHQVEESTRFHPRDRKTCECSRKDNQSGLQRKQKDNSIQPSCRDLASLLDIQDTGASCYQLLQRDISDLAHARVTRIWAEDESTLERPRKTQKESPTAPYGAGDSISPTRPSIFEPSSDSARLSSSCSPSLQNGPTASVLQEEEPTRIHQREAQTPKISRDANLLAIGVRGLPIKDSMPPYSGDTTRPQSRHAAIAGPARYYEARPAILIHNNAVPLRMLKARLHYLTHRRTVVSFSLPRTISQVLLEPAIAFLDYPGNMGGHSNNVIAATAKGQQGRLHSLVASSHQATCSPRLLNLSMTSAHQDDTPTRMHQGGELRTCKCSVAMQVKPQAARSSPYSEGALYALGLNYAAQEKSFLGMLQTTLHNTTGEVVQHDAALGVGVAGMASQDRDTYDYLKQTLFTDSAVAGEASRYSMGLVMLGSGSAEAIDETLHIAFICYSKQEQADSVIDKPLKGKNPVLQYGGVYSLALPYAGATEDTAVERLLYIAVSDIAGAFISLSMILVQQLDTLEESSTTPDGTGNRNSLMRPSTPEPSPLGTDVFREANTAPSYKCGDSTHSSSPYSLSLQNGPMTSVQQDKEPTRTHQRDQTPKSSQGINLLATSICRDAVPRKTLKLRPHNPPHRRAEVSLSRPRSTSQVLPEPAIMAITSFNYLGQQNLRHPPLASSRRVKKATHSHEHEESVHSRQGDTLTPGGSRETERPGSRHLQTEDSMQSHYQDFKTLKGSQEADLPGSRCQQTEDSTRPYYQDTVLPQGTRDASSPGSQHLRVEVDNIPYAQLTCVQPEDKSLLKLHCNPSSYISPQHRTRMFLNPKAKNNTQYGRWHELISNLRQNLFRSATSQQRLLMAQRCFQDHQHLQLIEASDSRQLKTECFERASNPQSCTRVPQDATSTSWSLQPARPSATARPIHAKSKIHSNQHRGAATSHDDVATRLPPDEIKYQDWSNVCQVDDSIPCPCLLAMSYNTATYAHSSSKVTSAQYSDEVQRHTASSLASATRLLGQVSATPFTAQPPDPNTSIEDRSGTPVDPKGHLTRSSVALLNSDNSAAIASKSHIYGDSVRRNLICLPSRQDGRRTLALQDEEIRQHSTSEDEVTLA